MPLAPSLWTEDHLIQPNTFWHLEISRVWSEGTLQIPLAAAPTSGLRVQSKIVRTSAPAGVMTVRWTAERTGDLPRLPSPVSRDPNARLASSVIGHVAPELETDGSEHTYRISGEYVYHLFSPVYPTDTSEMGSTAYDITPSAENFLGAADFVEGYF